MFRKGLNVAGALCLGMIMAASVFAASDNCLSVNGIIGRPTSNTLTAGYSSTFDSTGITFTYTFGSTDETSVNGVPGLISYCVYPQAGFLPDGAIVALATGADGAPFVAEESAKGSFSFTRAKGNSTNVPLDGATVQMGTAKWVNACVTDPISLLTQCNPPTTQTILLHINDPAQCDTLYNTTGSTTCWVYPGGGPCDPANPLCKPPTCNGDPACKSATIDEATGAFDAHNYPIVPLKTLLHIHYTYVIVNQPGSGVTMTFLLPTPNKTQDINSGGGKDYFGCEQTPDTSATALNPGGAGNFPDYQGTGFNMNFQFGNGSGCPQSRFFLTAPGTITLSPGGYKTFTVDMVTRSNKGSNQEYTSAGPHILNSGFTVKWFQDGPSAACSGWVNKNTLCSFSTGLTPLYVDAQ